ncbi:Retrovirus-related Pol polyprotein from transposon 297 [Anthophora plagiata]
MESQGVIEKSESPWSSPIVLVKKKDGSTRFCVDYRRLNSITKKDSYPLPRIEDTLDALVGSSWFSTVDLQSGYWQISMEEADREKTAFCVGSGLWQFKVMPFGLCNAPATFERLMESVLRGLNWKVCLVYLDDVIIFGGHFAEELARLRQVFSRLRRAGLLMSPRKCSFFCRQVRYLGHIVTETGVKTDPEKVKAITEWPVPRNVTELRSFLGLCSYYRKFVRNFAGIAAPLHRLTEGKIGFSWSQECQGAFRELKGRLTAAPVLVYPDSGKDFILDTDASNFAIGAVLSQEQGSQEKVVAYFSKSLGRAERNYCVTRRELLAVVKAIAHFHHYLYGRKFLVRTDHAALGWLLSFKNPEGQVARWLERLQEYDFEVRHREGKAHGNADGLSRRPCAAEHCKRCSRLEEKDLAVEMVAPANVLAISCETLDPEAWRRSQFDDEEVAFILGKKERGEKPARQEVARFLRV